MTISQRLRTCARHTGLDAVIELLNEAADEIERLSASAALPTLQPGDSHSESLIEAAIQGHADTREAMRWLVRQLVPATQAEVTDEQIEQVLSLAHAYADAKMMRYGALGIEASPDPDEAFQKLRHAILALRPVPMTGDAQPIS